MVKEISRDGIAAITLTEILASPRLAILSTDDLDSDYAGEVVEELLELDKKRGDIFLLINTPGGSAGASMMLADIITALKNRVATVGLGHVWSAAIPPFVAGEVGMRFITGNTDFYFHLVENKIDQYRDAAFFANEAKYAASLQQREITFITSRTALEPARVEQLMRDNTYLDAAEAVTLGLADRIIE